MSRVMKLSDYLTELCKTYPVQTLEETQGTSEDDNQVEAEMRVNMCRSFDAGFKSGQAYIINAINNMGIEVEIDE